MRVVLVGAGQRGRIYADYMHDSKQAEIAAIVEPHPGRRKAAAEKLNVPDNMCFETVEALWAKGKMADVALIASMDRDHFVQVMTAIGLGYDVLLEKPISPSREECLTIQNRARELNRRVVVCHVLRYTPFFSTLKKLLDDRVVGKMVSIQHEENIGNWHMAHSFVRGNWASSEKTSPIILQKSCHDMDILVWLAGGRAKALSSVGALTYFRPENAPKGSGERCCDCMVRENCRFNAEKAYLSQLGVWPAAMVTLDQTPEGLREALETSPYGRCVYRCGNNVCDTQSTLIEFESGVAVNFTMSAFTNRMNRTIRILCEDGEICGNDGENLIRVTRFAANAVEPYQVEEIHTAVTRSGHGGGDTRLVDDFFRVLLGEEAYSTSSIDESIESHLMAFAAEQSRLEGGIRVALDDLRQGGAKA